MTFYLAQMNIAKAKLPLTDPSMKEFVDFIEPINALAEGSPGFIWRWQSEDGQSSIYAPSPFDDDSIINNLSVWEDLESLKTFVYNTAHSYFVRSRQRWFDKLSESHMVLWWLPKGEIPTLEEGKRRLELFNREGASIQAFTFATPYEPPTTPASS